MKPPAPNPPLGGRAARAEARDKANENVRKAEQDRQQASNDAAQNPNDASKQAKDLEAQQKLDQAVTDAAKLTDNVRQANQAYQDAYQAADRAANDSNTPYSEVATKIRDLGEAKKNYEAKLEEEKAKNARANAPNWNRQRFAEQMQRQATQQGTPQTQPGNIGQTTPPTAAQVPKLNVVTDTAGGGEGYNVSGYTFGWSGAYGKGDWGLRSQVVYSGPPPPDEPPGGPKVAPVEYVRVCNVYGTGFYYIPGTDTCLRIGDRVSVDAGGRVRIEFAWTDIPNQVTGLRSREPVRLPDSGAEKDTETGSQDGPIRWLPGDGSLQVDPQQGSAFGIPPGTFVPNASPHIQVQIPNYQYGGSVADVTGQSGQPPVQVPQGFQANSYDFSVGDSTFRRFDFRCTPNLQLTDLTTILQTTYSRTEDDTGRDKEPALDTGPASAAGQVEKLPQVLLDLRPPAARVRGHR